MKDTQKRIKEIKDTIKSLEKELKELESLEKPFTLVRKVDFYVYTNGGLHHSYKKSTRHSDMESVQRTIKAKNHTLKNIATKKHFNKICVEYVVVQNDQEVGLERYVIFSEPLK